MSTEPTQAPGVVEYRNRDTAGPASWAARLPGWAGALLALIILVAVTAIREPAFLQVTNLVNILNNYSAIGIIAVGMTIVIILGGIDLSVGSLLALAGGLGILALNAIYAPPGDSVAAVLACAAVAIGIGALAGFFNGVLIAKGKMAPFIATLAALVIYRSVATWMANGGQFFSEGSDYFEAMGVGFPVPGTNIGRAGGPVIPFSFPYAILVWAAVLAGGAVLLNRTRFGRYVIAIGSNERAAVYSAIAVDRVKLIAYTLLGALTGLAGLIWAAKYESVNSANAGLLIELDVIAAVVIGGTRMSGGAGSIAGTFIGVLLIGVIRNMLVMFGVTSHAHGLVMGLIIIAAVLIQRATPRR